MGLKFWQLEPKKDFQPEAHDDYAPNPVQLEFIRLCARKYWYLAFGDTDHSSPHIQAFATTRKTVAELENAGKKNYFLEARPVDQYYFDFLRKDTQEHMRHQSVVHIELDKIRRAQEARGSMWNANADRRKLRDLFERAARNVNSLRFIAADQRLRDEEKFNDAMLRVRRHHLRSIACEKLLQKFHDVTGHDWAWLSKKLGDFSMAPLQDIDKGVFDDRATAGYVGTFEGPAAFFFGAAHFDTPELVDGRAFLGSLLPKSGKSMCVLEIFHDMEQRAKMAEERNNSGEQLRRADAELFVENAPGVKHGIRINNPDLLPLYEQAVKNAQAAGLTPQEMTRQPLPS